MDIKKLIELGNDARIKILQHCFESSNQIYIVGGTVRDVLLGLLPVDLDLACKITPDEIITRLQSAKIKVIPTGLKHQTITCLPLSDQPPIEITTFRGPHMSPKGGVVQSNSIEEDLNYRDFTINALAFSVIDRQLIDPHEGEKDLKAKLVRAVSDPRQRFIEDPLRILRMVRLSCSLDFKCEVNTFNIAKELHQLLKQISIERIRDEFTKILLSNKPDIGIRLLSELGILSLLFPEIAIFVDFEQNRFHKADLFEHTLEVIRNTQPNLILRLAALLHDVGKPQTLSIDPETSDRHFYLHEKVGSEISRTFLERLRFSHTTTDAVATLVATHMRPIEAGPGGYRRLLRDTGELFPLWRELKQADACACKVDTQEMLTQLKVFDQAIERIKNEPLSSPLSALAINGNDLLNLGIPHGPRIGEILRQLHERVLDDPSLNNKTLLLELAKNR